MRRAQSARYACSLDTDKPSARLLEEDAKLRNDVAAAELISALNDAGIKSILLKGPSIARWLYDDGESRPYGDVDLLVSPLELAAAELVAEKLGFKHLRLPSTRLGEESHHESWFRTEDGVCVELHRGFRGIGVSDQQFWDELAAQTETLPLGVGGIEARVLTAPARAMLIGLHAAQHGPAGTPLSDLERALQRLPAVVWSEAAALARRLDAEPAFAIGLSLVPAGSEVVRGLGLEPAASTEALLFLSGSPRTAEGWEWFARSRGVRGKLRFIVAKLAPPLDFMRVVDPIGQRGNVWLPLAYLVRPFRLARSAPRGFFTWRDARRRATRP